MLLALCLAAAPASAQQATTVVPNYWGLIPSGLGPGDEFRLLFVSSTDRDATPRNIGTYNTWIQNLAANGHGDIRGYSSTFRVVGSTRAVDARDNTETTGTGVPIYWLNGDQVADNYPDFYDGSWDQEASMRTESGSTVAAVLVTGVWTGSAHDGTEGTGGGFSNALGSNRGVTLGRPNGSNFGDGPLSSTTSSNWNGSAELYGLSGVFRVNQPLPPEGDLGATNVFAKRYSAGEVKITWNDITIDGAPLPPGLPDYAVTVSGGRRNTTWALSHLETLFGDPLGRGNRYTVEHPTSTSTNNNQSDDDVAFTYTLKVIGDGWLASGKTFLRIDCPAVGSANVVDCGLSTAPSALRAMNASAYESYGPMQFRVEVDPAASGRVTVDYATADRPSGSKRALAGQDYYATSGTLTFAPGETAKFVVVGIIDDAVNDDAETFYLNLSNAVGATISDGQATGKINNTEPLTASFEGVPEAHDGQSAFSFRVAFSEEIGISSQTLRDESFTTTGGAVTGAQRVDGRNDLWEITVEPSGAENVTITLPRGRDCGTTGAVCTDEDTPRPLTNSPSATVKGPPDESPAVSVADASATEGNAVEFTVSLSGASGQQVTAQYATSNGTAESGTDFTAASGTVTFAAGETSQTVSVATTDDSVDEEDETLTVTLSSPANATLGDATATGTIVDNDDALPPLTASFGDMPASHTDEDFTFGLVFSEEVEVGYQTLRDTAFAVTGGEVKTAQRQQQGSNQAWDITVEPDGQGAVTITLPETTDCGASGAICTGDGRPLSHSLSSVVAGPVSIPAVSVSDASAAEGDAVAFTVSLSPASSQQVTVEYATSGGTATSGTDFTAESGTLTFAANETTKTVSVATTDDSVDESDETFTLTLSSPANATLGDATATGTINDNDESLPTVGVSDAGAAEGDAVAFTVSLSEASSQQVTVEYATSGGTATSGTDFTAESGTLTFAANETSKTVSVATTDDSVDEEDEIFTLTLSSPANATLGDATATGTINDDDVATTSLTASFGDMPDSHTGREFTFGLAFSEEVELSYVTLRDTAFAVTGGAVKTAQRQQQGSNQAWDITVEPDGRGAVTITLPETTDCGASGAICTGDGRPLSHSLSSVVAGPVSIPAVSVSDASAAEGDAVAFTVSLSTASSQQVTVQYATSGGTATSGTDFTAESGTLTFAANETSKTVSVATTDDSVDEDDETFTLTLSSPANATLGDATATGTINDNDESLPTVGVSDASAAEGDAVAFTVSLSPASSRQVTVQYATSGGTATSGTDFTAESGTLTFAANETSKTVSVATTDDSVDEDDETFTLTLSSPANATLGDATATGTINDNDDDDSLPAVSVSDASAAEGDAVVFTVSLSPASSRQVTVDYATSGGTATSGTDFTAESGTLTFAANETSKTVSVATTDDSVDEDDETFTLTLSSPANATLGDATATGTINDDDNDNAAPLTASFSNMPASHGGGEFTFGLTFSEEVELSYKTLRDDAFAVTGGEVKRARRQQQGSNQAWDITVKPTSANDKVTITLPETTDCNASDAICTHDGRPLSHSLSATVVVAASSSAGDAANGDIEDDALGVALGVADGLTPEEATQALFGERRLSEAQLTALDRLGNRNGRYDLGDVLSWIERCRRGEARCGRSSTDSGPASAAALLGAAAAGRRRTSKQPKRGDSGHRGSLPIRGMRRRARMTGSALAMLLAATTAWSCTDGSVGPTAAEQDPGFLTIEWTGPAAARDIGVLLELEGPGIETVRAPGLDLYESSAPGRHQVVVAGSLRAGPLMQFRVPDRGQLPLYRVRVVQVTGEDYALRDPGEYRAVITVH